MADAGRKQLEQVMHQLQEQLQINLLQQSHIMQAGDKAGKLIILFLQTQPNHTPTPQISNRGNTVSAR